MAIDNTQIQKKKGHAGFFVLLAIIAVVVFTAYTLTKNQKYLNPNSNLVNIEKPLTKAEQEAIVKSFSEAPAQKSLTKNEQQAILKSVANIPPEKPLTEAEQKAIIASFQN